MSHPPELSGISKNPAILGGKPTIAGTRIGVDLILEKIGDGESIEDILLDYPHLTREQITAAIQYAVQLVRTASA